MHSPFVHMNCCGEQVLAAQDFNTIKTNGKQHTAALLVATVRAVGHAIAHPRVTDAARAVQTLEFVFCARGRVRAGGSLAVPLGASKTHTALS